MGHLPGFAGIGREHQGDLAICAWRPGKLDVGGDPIRNCLDTLGLRSMSVAGELQIFVAFARFLEGGDAGKDPPVDFRQHHMHGEISRREAAFRLVPGLSVRT